MRNAAAWLGFVVFFYATAAAVGSAAQETTPQTQILEEMGSPPKSPSPSAFGTPNLGASAKPSPQPAPDPDLLHDVILLDSLLLRSAEETIREEKFAAASGITGGMILIGLASWRLIENTPQNQFSRGLGVMFMTLGFADLTTGIFAARRIPHEKRRVDRWERMKIGGVGKVELARMEGELRAASETRQGDRLLVRWNGLTHAIAGVLVFAFSPIPNNDQRDRRTAWVVGGLFITTGAAAFGLSFRSTPSERAWRDYQAQKASSTTNKVSLRVAPALWRGGAGIAAGGTF